jgi:hypothetical protein
MLTRPSPKLCIYSRETVVDSRAGSCVTVLQGSKRLSINLLTLRPHAGIFPLKEEQKKNNMGSGTQSTQAWPRD